jgi:plasmid segregation protein ParM
MNEMNAEIIGIDHGNAYIKTKNNYFPNGVTRYDFEPYTSSGVLEYDGRFYVCGSGRLPLLKDKTETNDFYLLTLAALAQEVALRTGGNQAEVTVAAGLPLTGFGLHKEKFRAYLLKDNGQPVEFFYESRIYEITIKDVLMFPQGYAAIFQNMDLIENEPSVILCDVGGWTVDLMRLDNTVPNAESCRSLELGMIRCYDEVSEQVRRNTGKSLTTTQIETILKGGQCSVNENVRETAGEYGGRFVRKLLSAISESGFDAGAMPVVFIGGGAGLMERYITPQDGLCRSVVIDDVCANAAGYEYAARRFSRGIPL